MLIGTRAVTTIPQFQYFASSEPQNLLLGAHRPLTPALLLLDSIAPEDRSSAFQQAASYGCAVWILWQDSPSPEAIADLVKMRRLQASLMAILPLQSLVLHDIQCWSNANWVSKPSQCASQVWLLSSPDEQDSQHPEPCHVKQLHSSLIVQAYCVDFLFPLLLQKQIQHSIPTLCLRVGAMVSNMFSIPKGRGYGFKHVFYT